MNESPCHYRERAKVEQAQVEESWRASHRPNYRYQSFHIYEELPNYANTRKFNHFNYSHGN